MASDHVITFSVLDYILFALTLSLSALIGVFYAIKAYRNKENLDAFLTGSRKMPLLPTTLSLLVSFISGITIISYPVEAYTHGLVFFWQAVGQVFAPILSGIFVLPVLYRMKNSISIYSYFEYRFGSKLLRSYASFLYQANALVYIAVVLYAPSISLSAVTGIDVSILIVSVGVVCTIYTSIGGLKAVIWSDCFQAFVMYAGLLALAIQGTISGGGLKNVFDQANEHGRVKSMLNIDPNPLQYSSVWMGLLGGCFFSLTSFGTNQMALQRYYSLPTIKKARISIFVSVPAMLSVTSLVIYIGLTMIPRYIHCDPRVTEKLTKDQMVIYYMLDTLSGVYGLPGLFLACIFSGTLSSISSSINSLATCFLEDFVKPLCKEPLSDQKAQMITKGVGFLYGLTGIGLAFAAGPLGGIFKSFTSACGVLNGPLLGMFVLGLLVPMSNWIGALVGTIVASGLSLWIFVGSLVYKVDYPQLPYYTDQCPVDNATTPFRNATVPEFSTDWTEKALYTPELHGVEQIYAFAYVMYPFISAILAIIFGLAVSFCANFYMDPEKDEGKAFTFWNRNCIPDIIDEKRKSNDKKEKLEEVNGIEAKERF